MSSVMMKTELEYIERIKELEQKLEEHEQTGKLLFDTMVENQINDTKPTRLSVMKTILKRTKKEQSISDLDIASRNHCYHIPNDRSGVGTWEMVGANMRYDASCYYAPIKAIRRLPLFSYHAELDWFLRGDMDTKFLEDKGVKFWRQFYGKLDNKESNPDIIGPMYPILWRAKPVITEYSENGIHVDTIDQIQYLLDKVKEEGSYSRRIKLSNDCEGLHPSEYMSPSNNVAYGKMALDPCHTNFQILKRPATERDIVKARMHHVLRNAYFSKIGMPEERIRDFVEPKYVLNGELNMRSNDLTIGAPANAYQYNLLLSSIAWVTGNMPGVFVHNSTSAHVYCSHLEGLEEEIRLYEEYEKGEKKDPVRWFFTKAMNEDVILKGLFSEEYPEEFRKEKGLAKCNSPYLHVDNWNPSTLPSINYPIEG